MAEAVIVHKATNTYEFPGYPVLHGSRLLTPDISVYEGYVHAPGLDSLYKYGWAWVFGSAQGVYADRSGNLFGTTPDGVVHDDFPGAGFAPIPDLGDAQPVLLPYGPGAAPRVDVYQRGGSSTFYLASSGRQIQAATAGAHAGDKDVIDVREATAGDLTGFKYRAQSTGTQVSPTLGLPLGERQVVTFRWTPLALAAGQDIEVGMDPANKRTTLTNRSGGTRAYTLFVNAVDGPSSQQGIWVYSGLGIAQGATQRTTLSTWPDAGHLQLATDANGDGTFESTTTLTGTRCDTAPTDCNLNRVSDLCDIAMGDSQDANHDHVPDECPVVQ